MSMEWELRKAASIVVKDMLCLKEGENVLIYADTASDRRVVESIAAAAHAAGGEAGLYWYETRPEVGLEPPKPLAAAMKAVDINVEVAEKYLIHTEAYHEALRAGARNMCLTGMTPDMMIRCIGQINYPKMVELGDALAKLTRNAQTMKISAPGGTELTCKLDSRPVFHNSGVISKPGDQSFLGGQVSWAPVEETINGKLVFDGALWPPEEIGLLKTPIDLTIERGVVTGIQGGSEAKIFENWVKNFDDPNMYKLAHYSYGFNPGARLTGKILEDERVLGSIEMGIGSQRPRFEGTVGPAKAHTDGIVLNPTIELDGVVIEEKGKYVHPELARISEAFGG
ncbi:MAG: aminopeptidase [Candidatus Heimdallarchaeota archaeon]